MRLDEIIADLKAQIDWRGPGGQPQGHIVLPRNDAAEVLEYLTVVSRIVQILQEKDSK